MNSYCQNTVSQWRLYIASWRRGGFVLVQARTVKKKCFFNHIVITGYYYCLTSAPLSQSDLDVNMMTASSYSACLETMHHKQSEALCTAQLFKNVKVEVNIYIFWESIKALWKSKFSIFFNKRNFYNIPRDFINRPIALQGNGLSEQPFQLQCLSVLGQVSGERISLKGSIMYHIIKQTISLFLEETPAHKYLIVSDSVEVGRRGEGEMGGGSAESVCCFCAPTII